MNKSRLLSIAVAVAGLAVAVTGFGPASASASSHHARSAPAVVRAHREPYLAESQDIKLVRYYRPGCRSGCLISGDSTAALYDMTWYRWGRMAVGRGSYHLDDCRPNCATGKIYKIPAIVKLERPVKACDKGGVRYFYSRVAFRFPKGLPKVFRGPDKPLNPWTFTSVIQEAKQSCR